MLALQVFFIALANNTITVQCCTSTLPPRCFQARLAREYGELVDDNIAAGRYSGHERGQEDGEETEDEDHDFLPVPHVLAAEGEVGREWQMNLEDQVRC